VAQVQARERLEDRWAVVLLVRAGPAVAVASGSAPMSPRATATSTTAGRIRARPSGSPSAAASAGRSDDAADSGWPPIEAEQRQAGLRITPEAERRAVPNLRPGQVATEPRYLTVQDAHERPGSGHALAPPCGDLGPLARSPEVGDLVAGEHDVAVDVARPARVEPV
jgi:hypothetical protein